MLVLTQCPFLSIDIDKVLKNTNDGPMYFIISYLHISLPSKAQHFYEVVCLKKKSHLDNTDNVMSHRITVFLVPEVNLHISQKQLFVSLY